MLNQINTFIGSWSQTYNTALDNAQRNSLAYSIHVPLLHLVSLRFTRLNSNECCTAATRVTHSLMCQLDALVQLISHAKSNYATCGTPVTCSSYRRLCMQIEAKLLASSGTLIYVTSGLQMCMQIGAKTTCQQLLYTMAW